MLAQLGLHFQRFVRAKHQVYNWRLIISLTVVAITTTTTNAAIVSRKPQAFVQLQLGCRARLEKRRQVLGVQLSSNLCKRFPFWLVH